MGECISQVNFYVHCSKNQLGDKIYPSGQYDENRCIEFATEHRKSFVALNNIQSDHNGLLLQWSFIWCARFDMTTITVCAEYLLTESFSHTSYNHDLW
jgi:hypothetical protein